MAQRSGRGASEASWKATLGLSRPVPTFPGCGTPGSVPAAQTLLCPPISRGPRCPEARAGRGSACPRCPAAWEAAMLGMGTNSSQLHLEMRHRSEPAPVGPRQVLQGGLPPLGETSRPSVAACPEQAGAGGLSTLPGVSWGALWRHLSCGLASPRDTADPVQPFQGDLSLVNHA